MAQLDDGASFRFVHDRPTLHNLSASYTRARCVCSGKMEKARQGKVQGFCEDATIFGDVHATRWEQVVVILVVERSSEKIQDAN